ncbi:MurR/RpiR family transcriptional regulator [Streptomyces cylindrosporus]|uniref:MurR/RpiR family transcriptional regulator n=1 Tax=Streptomyces cylindrosporus TaxID=2927583 RepID=A0ABS9YDB8_9ACTN|nr:MurR/RpiR family transcriptional regulator [Streptomyces cylindrosporus]MCI3274949.1 MurR/RpiR family transcriptional regulator [Streptomyces cylindrosporus]
MTIEAWLTDRTAGTLGPQAGRVIHVLARAPQFASYSSAREVAERAGVNVSTVVRTAQQLGFDGWPQLREELRARFLTSVSSGDLTPGPAADPAAQTLRQDAHNINALAAPETLDAIRATARAVKAARRTLVISSGSGAGPAHILSYLGTIAGHDIQLALGSPTTQAVQVARLEEGDCLIAVNVWRLTRTLRALTRLAHQRGATVIVLTDLRSSPLAEDADHLIVTPVEGIHGGPSLTAMVATVQAVLSELSDDDAIRSSGHIQQMWEELDLMDDQP